MKYKEAILEDLCNYHHHRCIACQCMIEAKYQHSLGEEEWAMYDLLEWAEAMYKADALYAKLKPFEAAANCKLRGWSE